MPSHDHVWRSIADIIEAVCQEQNPSDAMKLLLSGTTELTAATTGRLVLISLRDSCYRAEFEALNGPPGDSSEDRTVPFSLVEDRSIEVCPVLRALRSRQPVILSDIQPQNSGRLLSPSSRSALIAPIVRNESCLGLLMIEKTSPQGFDDKALQTVETAVAITVSLLEKRSTLELFKAVQQPIDFYRPINDFFEEILYLISEASGMKYVVIRELQPDNSTLKCLARFGFESADGTQLDLMDLSPISEYPSFQKAVHGEAIAEPNMSAPHLETLRNRPELASIRSFVVMPIKVGKSIFGTLSLAAECVYNYSELELAGFETIANSVGVGINNYRNAEQVHDIFDQTARVAISFTALEVAQAVRHEARGAVDNCNVLVATLIPKLQRLSKEDRETSLALIEDIEKSLTEVRVSIDKIRDAAKMPEMKLHPVSVRTVWTEAIATVAGKLDKENVRYDVSGDATISAYPEALRLIFLNLLLNSLDAFHEFGKKGGRRITVSIDPRGEAAQHIKIRYHDNASGIDAARLKVPADVARKSVPLKDLIFELGVTSKSTGSGYGLFLVRRILGTHHGSIDLVDHKAGVTFDITLPKVQTIAAAQTLMAEGSSS